MTEELGSVASAHKDLERELEEACEAEDIERAKRISDSIVALEKENNRLLMALCDANIDYDSMDSELQDILESRIAAEEEVGALLEHFAKVNQLNLYFFTSHKPDLVDSELQDVLESHIAAEEEVATLLQQFAKVI
jgi:hypothetical protein